MNRITVVAPINTYTGFGQLAIEMVKQLEKAGQFVTIRQTGWSEAFGARIPCWVREKIVNGPQAEPWEVAMQSVNYRCTPGKKTLFFTMWETTSLPASSVHLLNEAEVIVVPNQWNASCFVASGVTRPIRVVPLGIDPKVYYLNGLNTNAADGVFKFGCSGRWFHGAERKGINETIELFQRAFPGNEKVMLECKRLDCPTPEINDPRIIFHKGFWTEEQMANWYRSLDCFISLALGEGWGLHQHQSLAVGRPLISPKFGGVAEFFDDRCGWPVRFNLEPVPQPNRFRYIGSWAKMDADDAVRQMRNAIKDRALAEHKGQVGSEIAARFTWDNFGRELCSVLQEFGAI